MKAKLLCFLLFGIILISTNYSCKKDEIIVADSTVTVNKWIYENMQLYYLWNNYIPTDIDYTKESEPALFFYKLIYNELDQWSWITDDYASLAAEFSGTQTTMGYAPAFYLLNDNKTVVFVVKYVYPGSAAEQAGLERGDIILTINNTTMNTENYYDLYSGTSYTVQLGVNNSGTLSPSGESLSLTAQSTTTDPAIYHTIFEENGTKIGYLVYVEFVNGNNNIFLSSLNTIFSEFNAAGITELIVDLRYNPGGEISTACHLASQIAPASVIASEPVLVNMQYNTDLQAYFESNPTQFADNLHYKFTNQVTNANMQKVYILTTSGTASASELLISGLDPYMTVVQIGESTHGKYTGAIIKPDDNEKWAIIPIVMKYSNIEGYTDFVNGLSPNYEVDDNLLNALPFGDKSDPLLAKAINLIKGITTKTAPVENHLDYKEIIPEKLLIKENLFVPVKASDLKAFRK